MKQTYIGLVALLLSGIAPAAWAGGDWSGARSQFERFKSEYENLRALTPQETRRVVDSACDADAEERKSVSQDVASRVGDLVKSKFDDLEKLKDDTLHRLDEVLADEELKDNHSEARGLKDETNRRWETIERMTRSIRAKNHPVVRFLIQEGEKAHDERQRSSECDVSEFTVDSGRADCLNASSCKVIELKPDNSRAISKGRDQARRYTDDLNNKAELRTKLTEKNSNFSHCEKFEFRVDCYKLCPEIDPETNEMKSVSASWRTDC